MFKDPADEAELLEQMKWLLGLLERLGHLCWFRIHVMPVIRGQTKCESGGVHFVLSKNTDMAGFADLIIFSKGRTGFIETKSRRGILSAAQRLFRERVTRNGHPYQSVKRLEEAITFLVEKMEVPVYGVLKGFTPASNSDHRPLLGSAGAAGVPDEGGQQPNGGPPGQREFDL